MDTVVVWGGGCVNRGGETWTENHPYAANTDTRTIRRGLSLFFPISSTFLKWKTQKPQTETHSAPGTSFCPWV